MEEDKLSLEEMLTQAGGGTVEPEEVVEPVETVEAVEPEEVVEPKEPVKDKTANPMKEVRDKLNIEQKEKQKIQGAIQKFTTGDYEFKLKDFVVDGEVDYDALTAKMEEVDLAEKAKGKGVSPEVQAEIDRLEVEKLELSKERLRVGMDKALNNLQLERQLKPAEINNFFKDALATKRNPYQWIGQGGNLDDLYFLIYKDKLVKTQVDEAVAAEKTKWEEQAARQGKLPAKNPANPKAPPPTPRDGMSFEEMLEAAARK